MPSQGWAGHSVIANRSLTARRKQPGIGRVTHVSTKGAMDSWASASSKELAPSLWLALRNTLTDRLRDRL